MQAFLLSVLASVVASAMVLIFDKKRLPKLAIKIDNGTNVVNSYEKNGAVEKWKFVRISVLNKEAPFLLKLFVVRQTAENCRAQLIFFNEVGEKLFVMRGRWKDTPEIVHLSPNDQVVKTLYPDPANIGAGCEEVLDCIAMKDGDHAAYGWNNEAYFNSWKTPDYKLPQGKYRVKIEINTQNGVSFSRLANLQVGNSIATTFFI